MSGASLRSQPLNESIGLSVLQGQTVKGITEGNPCPRHGTRYWLFKKAGPCLHPQCVKSDLEFFGAASTGRVFRTVIKLGVEDFISWAATEGFVYLVDCWRKDVESWKPLCIAYIKHRKLEYVRGPKMRAEIQEWLQSEVSAQRYSSHGTKQDYPDSMVWIKQCANFLMDQFGPAVTASVFGCVEITDVARLCFNGDITKARIAHEQALEELKRWHESKISKT